MFNQSSTYNELFNNSNIHGKIPEWTRVLFFIYLFVIYVSGVIGNIFVVIIYWRTKPKSACDWLIMSLGICDLIVCAVSPLIYFRVEYPIDPPWSTKLECSIEVVIQLSTLLASCWMLTAIATDRYMKLCQSRFRSLTPSSSRNLCVCICLISLLVACIPNIVQITGYNTMMSCRKSTKGLAIYFTALLVNFVIAIFIVIFAYGSVIIVIGKKVKRKQKLLEDDGLKTYKSCATKPNDSALEIMNNSNYQLKNPETIEKFNHNEIKRSSSAVFQLLTHNNINSEEENTDNYCRYTSFGDTKAEDVTNIEVNLEVYIGSLEITENEEENGEHTHLVSKDKIHNGLQSPTNDIDDRILSNTSSFAQNAKLERGYAIDSIDESDVLLTPSVDIVQDLRPKKGILLNRRDELWYDSTEENRALSPSRIQFKTDVECKLKETSSVFNYTDCDCQNIINTADINNECDCGTPSISLNSSEKQTQSGLGTVLTDITLNNSEEQTDLSPKQNSSFLSRERWTSFKSSHALSLPTQISEELPSEVSSLFSLRKLRGFTSSGGSSTSTASRGRFQLEKQMTLMLLSVTLSFILSWVPAWIIYISYIHGITIFTDPLVARVAYRYFISIHLINFATSPYIYYRFNPTFRSKVKELLKKCFCCCKKQSENVSEA